MESLSENHLVYIQRGRGTVLLHDGHQYHKKVQFKNESSLWRCTEYKKKKCTGSVTLQNGKVIKYKQHVCLQNHAQNEINIHLYKCKQDVLSEECPPVPKVYKKFVQSLENKGINLIQQIPAFSKIKSGLYKSRNAHLGVNKICHDSACEVVIPEKYAEFVLGDYNCDGIRVIIFCSEDAKDRMRSVKHCFSDGTFKSCPPPFAQLYIIQGDIGSSSTVINVSTLIYALMSERMERAYSILIQLLKSQLPEWCPTKFMTDFESPARKAIESEFPKIVLKGCFCHFKNSLRRKGKVLGLLKNKLTRRIVSLCSALPLLPEHKIMEGWTYIKEKCPPNNPGTKQFINYMSRFWIKDANFIGQWCIFREQFRTNNSLEGSNFKLNSSIGKKNPNLIHLIRNLKEDASFQTIKNKQKSISCSGDASSSSLLKKKDKGQIMIDNWIQEAQMELLSGSITVGHFLEEVK